MRKLNLKTINFHFELFFLYIIIYNFFQCELQETHTSSKVLDFHREIMAKFCILNLDLFVCLGQSWPFRETENDQAKMILFLALNGLQDHLGPKRRTDYNCYASTDRSKDIIEAIYKSLCFMELNNFQDFFSYFLVEEFLNPTKCT